MVVEGGHGVSRGRGRGIPKAYGDYVLRVRVDGSKILRISPGAGDIGQPLGRHPPPGTLNKVLADISALDRGAWKFGGQIARWLSWA